METKDLKKYAPQARRDFIEAVTNKAAVYGLLPDETLPMQEEGDVVIIGERAFPRTVAKQRKELETRIRKEGFQQFIEAVAYTWFNRFVAIRYMELHGYLDHGYRVLSHPEGKSTPEIIDYAERVELPGLDRDAVIDLKLDGGKDEELYQTLLIAQCNALHSAMPFLFESVRDGAELLLPDNLLHTDSLVRTLAGDIPEDQWENVEIIGWLYQFYISDRKDEVMGKTVANEDIPAATQLFTPNWIVKYLVQNSLGRQWMTTYPDSTLREQMEFYIEPARQTAEVQQQLDEIKPDVLNPEELTLVDPACGSGHILVEAYDLFKAIYTERGYRARDIPKQILSKNLFGLEIDDRAAQLASFALMMKARADDRAFFDRDVQPHLVAIQTSEGLDAVEIVEALNEPILAEEPPPSGELFEEIADEKSPLFSRKNMAQGGSIQLAEVQQLIDLFADAKAFGSLIQIPAEFRSTLDGIRERVEHVANHGNLLDQAAAARILPLLTQAEILLAKFQCVVANPPYMGSNYMSPTLKAFAKRNYSHSKNDLYAMFIERGQTLKADGGSEAIVSMHSWMFLSRYQQLREALLSSNRLSLVAHFGIGAFSELNSKVVQTVAFVFDDTTVNEWKPTCFRLIEDTEGKKRERLLKQECKFTTGLQDDYFRIPGTPIAYWASDQVRSLFKEMSLVGNVVETREGMATAGNERFLRFWAEVDQRDIGFGIESNEASVTSGRKWFPYVKGGDYRKWFGNNTLIVNWQDDGTEVKGNVDPKTGRVRSHNYNGSYGFRQGLTWTGMSNSKLSMRFVESGSMFDAKGPMAFAEADHLFVVQGVLNSAVGDHLMQILAPTLDYKLGHIMSVPIVLEPLLSSCLVENVRQCIEIAKADWNMSECSWEFETHPFVDERFSAPLLKDSFDAWSQHHESQRRQIARIEESNNEIIAEVYQLENEIEIPLSDDDITLQEVTPELECSRFLSYAVGCMMGRYNLGVPGIAYAQAGNENFNISDYQRFAPDTDGIIPLTSDGSFSDDFMSSFVRLLGELGGTENAQANLTFVSDTLCGESNSPADALSAYMNKDFYEDHLRSFRAGSQAPKRPIYWLFSSGKQKAFQCLVYLHRYNAGTLSRMRTEYVVKLQGKINARIEHLENDIPAASSTSHRKKLEKEQGTLIKQRDELQTFDEKLRHYADLRIELDLDDGVKVNYGKFGDLLAEVKKITGKKPEDIAAAAKA